MISQLKLGFKFQREEGLPPPPPRLQIGSLSISHLDRFLFLLFLLLLSMRHTSTSRRRRILSILRKRGRRSPLQKGPPGGISKKGETRTNTDFFTWKFENESFNRFQCLEKWVVMVIFQVKFL